MNSPQPFSSSCSSLYLLHSMGGVIRFFQKRMFFVKKLMFGVSLGIGALTDRNHGCRPGWYGVSLGFVGFRWDLPNVYLKRMLF